MISHPHNCKHLLDYIIKIALRNFMGFFNFLTFFFEGSCWDDDGGK